MKRYSKIIMVMITLATLGLLVPIGPANAAVTVDITVPPLVTPNVNFTVNVTVSNDSTTDTVAFNKVAALYLLEQLQYKGPYEVYTTAQTIPPGGNVSFSFPFRISYGRGNIVPLGVVLFNNKYDFNNAVGLNFVGVSVAK